MFENNKILLLGEKIEIKDFLQYDVIGIIGGGYSGIEDLQFYSYDYLLNIPSDTKIIVVDDNWDFEARYGFNVMITKLGLYIGEDYIYNTMVNGVLDTNIIYRLLDCSKSDFCILMKKIVGNRKLVVLHGNCQTHVLINLLGSHEAFNQKYITCKMPRLWVKEDIDELNILLESQMLKLTAYLFTQEVTNKNRFGYRASTEYMIYQVPDTCKIITISNLYFEGYFPQWKKCGKGNMLIDFWGLEGDPNRKFEFCDGLVDENVLRLIIEGDSDEEIIGKITADDFYNPESIRKQIEIELEEFRLREKLIDIKMSDYIIKNYDKFMMFATVNHPTRDVMVEFARRILNKLEINDIDIFCDEKEIQPPCPEMYYVIYPSVSKALNLDERGYKMHLKLLGRELPVLARITEELDMFIEDKENSENIEYNINMTLDFSHFMLIYIRILRAVIHI